MKIPRREIRQLRLKPQRVHRHRNGAGHDRSALLRPGAGALDPARLDTWVRKQTPGDEPLRLRRWQPHQQCRSLRVAVGRPVYHGIVVGGWCGHRHPGMRTDRGRLAKGKILYAKGISSLGARERATVRRTDSATLCRTAILERWPVPGFDELVR